MNTYKIYKYTNLITGMSYIGQTCRPLHYRAGKNMTGYRLCNKFWEAIEAYGTDCWTVEILWEGLTAEEANVYEDLEIHDNETLYPYGYNLIGGGMNAKRSPETCAKISKGRLGMSPEALIILVGWLLRDGWTQKKITRELRKNSRTIYKYAKLANLKKPTEDTSIVEVYDAETDIFVTAAAGLFATHTRDAKEIASLLNTTERTVYRWAEREKWEEVLQTLGYKGERNFRVKPRRN